LADNLNDNDRQYVENTCRTIARSEVLNASLLLEEILGDVRTEVVAMAER